MKCLHRIRVTSSDVNHRCQSDHRKLFFCCFETDTGIGGPSWTGQTSVSVHSDTGPEKGHRFQVSTLSTPCSQIVRMFNLDANTLIFRVWGTWPRKKKSDDYFFARFREQRFTLHRSQLRRELFIPHVPHTREFRVDRVCIGIPRKLLLSYFVSPFCCAYFSYLI